MESIGYQPLPVASINDSFILGRTNRTVTSSYTTSTEWTEMPQALVGVLATLAALVSICTTVGNIMVVISFIMEQKIRQPANYLIASLAVTDIIIGSSSMPLYTLYLLKGYWPLSDLACDLWLSLDYTVCLVSQYTVFLITLDRFFSVRAPARYRTWRTTTKMKVMIAATWTVPSLIFFSSILGWHHIKAAERISKVCMAMFQNSALFSAILVICYYWVTLVIMIGLYVGIYQVALGLQRRSKAAKKRIQKYTQNMTPTAPASETQRLLSSPRQVAPGSAEQTASSESSALQTGSGSATAEIMNDDIYSEKKEYLALPLGKEYLPTADRSLNNKAATNGVSTPENNNHNIPESPLWKPRDTPVDSRIHWNAHSGQTFVKTEFQSANGCKKSNSSCESPSPKVGESRRRIARKRAKRSQSRTNYGSDSSSETSESDIKPKVLGQLSTLVTAIVPASPEKRSKERKRTSSGKRNENRARKALRTITFILGAFVICWTPYHVIVLVNSFCKNCPTNDVLYALSYWLCYMNSPINPFCYALSNKEFKKSFTKIFKLTYCGLEKRLWGK
ncbi:muscarinic acetylcholine receptor gar-2-like [Watersipora subatra]|uniref:muscarinic acetylcholine receptor gar-2-like n=1 Tax=Watersipora subatra TaxID=2589382 RepID=UPI00355B804B